jgi:dTDP-4-dehydrorhamnose reductase
MRVLLLGKDGQLGRALDVALRAEQIQERNAFEVTSLGRAEADFAEPGAVRAAVEKYRPELIVNAAAYTAVDRAESEPELAMRVNGESVGALGEAGKRLGARVVHYSTDYVFDGEKQGAYVEGDAENPLNVYGRSKLAGERALLGSGAEAVILRTSWVYAAWGRNFVRTMLRVGAERDEVRVVDDQVGAPTAAEDLAAATLAVIGRWQADGWKQGGVYHAAAEGAVSWAGLAREIFRLAGKEVRVAPIASEDWVTAARRPLNSQLDCGKLAAEFGVRMGRWERGLERVVGEMVKG